MKTKVKVTIPPRSARCPHGAQPKISLPEIDHTAQGCRGQSIRSRTQKSSCSSRVETCTSASRISPRHSSRKDSKTIQLPMNSGPHAAVTGSTIANTPNDQLHPLGERDVDVDMSEDRSEDDPDYNSEDGFSSLSEGDNGDGDSDYIPESDSEDKQKPTRLKPNTSTYFLRNTTQREAKFLVSAVSDKSYNTRAKTSRAAKSG